MKTIGKSIFFDIHVEGTFDISVFEILRVNYISLILFSHAYGSTD